MYFDNMDEKRYEISEDKLSIVTERVVVDREEYSLSDLQEQLKGIAEQRESELSAHNERLVYFVAEEERINALLGKAKELGL